MLLCQFKFVCAWSASKCFVIAVYLTHYASQFALKMASLSFAQMANNFCRILWNHVQCSWSAHMCRPPLCIQSIFNLMNTIASSYKHKWKTNQRYKLIVPSIWMANTNCKHYLLEIKRWRSIWRRIFVPGSSSISATQIEHATTNKKFAQWQ